MRQERGSVVRTTPRRGAHEFRAQPPAHRRASALYRARCAQCIPFALFGDGGSSVNGTSITSSPYVMGLRPTMSGLDAVHSVAHAERPRLPDASTSKLGLAARCSVDTSDRVRSRGRTCSSSGSGRGTGSQREHLLSAAFGGGLAVALLDLDADRLAAKVFRSAYDTRTMADDHLGALRSRDHGS